MARGLLNSIAARTSVALGLVAVLCFAGAAWLIQRKAADEQQATAMRELEQLAASEAALLRGGLTETLAMVRGLALGMVDLLDRGDPDRAQASGLVRRYAQLDHSALGYWAEFEPNAFDGRDARYARTWPGGEPDEAKLEAFRARLGARDRVSTDSGRLSVYWTTDEKGKVSLQSTMGADNDPHLEDEGYYAAAKGRGAELMYEPYTDVVYGSPMLMTSLMVPLYRKDRFIGVAGADVTLKQIQNQLAKVRPYGRGVVRLLSPRGLVLAAPESSLLGKPWPRNLAAVMQQLRAGKTVRTEEYDASVGGLVFRVYVPVTAGRGSDVFPLMVSAPVDAVMSGVREVRNRVLLAGVVSVGLLVAVLSLLLRRLVGRPLVAVVRAVDAVAEGRLDYPIAPRGRDEISHVFTALRRMQSDLRERIDSERRVAAENLRVRIALDNAGTAMLIADEQSRIAYANPAMHNLVTQYAAELRAAFPDLHPERLEGQALPTLNAADDSTPAQEEIRLGQVTIVQTRACVTSDQGEVLGEVVEWRDRTQEVAVEAQVAEVIEAAAAGDLSRRIDRGDKTGFFLRLAEGVDRMLDAISDSTASVQLVLAALAKGDLTRRIQAEYRGVYGQMSSDANATMHRLADIMQRVRASVDAITSAANAIATGNRDLSERSEQQAVSLEKTAAAMEELTSTVKNNAESSRKAREVATGAAGIAARGGDVMNDVTEQMAGITDASKRIASIIGVIDDIAFQTNILALNAGVEAARAGEHGRGFAVVASEVRSLAQRSANAAREIKLLIAHSGERVDHGAALVAHASATMREIVEAVRQVNELMGQINAASDEQAAGISQVSQAVTQMDAATQQNVRLVEQATSAATSLDRQAAELSRIVAVFRTH